MITCDTFKICWRLGIFQSSFCLLWLHGFLRPVHCLLFWCFISFFFVVVYAFFVHYRFSSIYFGAFWFPLWALWYTDLLAWNNFFFFSPLTFPFFVILLCITYLGKPPHFTWPLRTRLNASAYYSKKGWDGIYHNFMKFCV